MSPGNYRAHDRYTSPVSFGEGRHLRFKSKSERKATILKGRGKRQLNKDCGICMWEMQAAEVLEEQQA